MKTEIRGRERLAAEIAARPAAGGKLPSQLRRDAIDYAQRRVAQGASRGEIARELGVAVISVQRWLEIAKRQPAQRVVRKLRRVRVVEPLPARSAIVVTTTQGLRVEGLGLGDVIALLRALG